MSTAARVPSQPKQKGFFREGLREIGRKLKRRKLRRRLQQEERRRGAALAQLGRNAWSKQADLSAFPELKQELGQLEARSGELGQATQTAQAEQARLEEQRNAESAKFDGQRRALDEKKRPADAALRAARQRLSDQQAVAQRMQARQSALPAELAGVEQQIASLTGSAAAGAASQLTAAQNRRQQLLAEQAQVAAELPRAQAALPPLAEAVGPLVAESQRLADELEKLEGERRSTLGQLDSALQQARQQVANLRQSTAAVEQERAGCFLRLGTGLYERKAADPALADDMQQIAAIEQQQASLGAQLQASLAESKAMPAGTMLKLTATLLLVVLVLGAAGYGAYWFWGERKAVEYAEGPDINPYREHALADHAAYRLANRLADARNQEQVANAMLEAFRQIGVGVYSPQGVKIIGGAERSQQDFFLYDFQWKILARAFYGRQVMDFDHHSEMLGKVLLQLNDPAAFTPILQRELHNRYAEAQQHPDDPNSFLVLLVDGLARRQVRPYSLSELGQRPDKDLYVDPLQSFLIMLDIFVQPPPGASGGLGWLRRLNSWSLLPSVHADDPCDLIKGDKERGYYGTGLSWALAAAEAGGEKGAEHVASEAAQQALKGLSTAAKGAGTVTDVAEGVGGLVILYGIDIKIYATNYTFHLQHNEDYTYGFMAKVTFNTGDLPQEPIRCGWMAGKNMPDPGKPMKDVELTWDIEPEWPDYLYVPHETVETLTGHLGFQTKTNADGESDFGIKPKECPDKKGRIVGRDLMMTASARVLTREIPSPVLGLNWIALIAKLGPGTIEYLMRGRTGYCRFRVEWHKKEPKQPQYGKNP